MLITLCNRESQHKWRRVKFIFEIVESEKDFALDEFEYDMKIRTKYIIIITINYSTRNKFLWIYYIEDPLSFRSIFLNTQDRIHKILCLFSVNVILNNVARWPAFELWLKILQLTMWATSHNIE